MPTCSNYYCDSDSADLHIFSDASNAACKFEVYIVQSSKPSLLFYSYEVSAKFGVIACVSSAKVSEKYLQSVLLP